ncbi:uncharacterized protein LOC130050562 [Ostrea edulis]|uniref:uncharacterized protein LOC130050562 n=1 Tax=Ostrea edulis TaxID=37623 RepID=UPI0024AED6F8|nr:uncharacterized protein LOC130050562 [Ostrea edulis]
MRLSMQFWNKGYLSKEQQQPMVPITTLKDRIKGHIDVDTVKSGPSLLFSQEQEALLSQHINAMAELGYGYSRVETINLAPDYAIHLGLRQREKPFSLKWVYNFLQRWPDLKVKKPRSLEAARVKCATRSVIDNNFKELDKIMSQHNFKERPHAIYNIDEKGLSTDHKPPKIVSGSSYKTQAVTSGMSQTITIIGAGNALGQQVPPYFVFPGKRFIDGLLDGASLGATSTMSDSGWSNTYISTSYIKDHLFKYLPHHDEKSPVLVLYDGHRSHISIGLIEWAKENNIILFVLPPHCSHLLQPLDVSCYGPFETAWNSACHRHLRESGGNVITRFDVCKIACKVYAATLTPSNIQVAFRKCGIYPYDPTVVSDSLVAPSLTFAAISSSTISPNSSSITSSEDKENEQPKQSKEKEFLECKGGQILQNVKAAKVRKTLSKVVAGKPITDDGVLQQIKTHIESQSSVETSKI